jgi:crotonobetainyl-CoA:carnitine CoA-transferase CaiB-like acyl-CoA transferase
VLVTIQPDDKDWTWVLGRRCSQCGVDVADYQVGALAAATRRSVRAWQQVLLREDVAVRPAPQVWSPLEYACHVRDVYRLFDGRLRAMLTEDDPQFANWDQDETAVAERYAEQDPVVVHGQLTDAGEAIATTFETVPEGAWMRPGRRSNGSVFTVESLGRYFLHDVLHHLHDVGHPSHRTP